jgi:phospholipase/carboxylesterase
MFPIETAWMARDELLRAGAHLTYREIPDLGHSYARAQNDPILRWFCPALDPR